MTPEETGKAYNTITHLWTRPEFNHESGMRAYKKALSFLPDASLGTFDKAVSERINEDEAQKKVYALDIGCGCTNRFIPIIEKTGLTYEGIDVSKDMLLIAASHLPTHTFYHDDICTFTLSKPYLFISAWDSFWHIPLTQQEPLLRKLVRHLADEGVLLLSCGGTDESGQHTNEVMGPKVYYASLGLHRYLEILIDEGCFVRHVEFDQHPELHAVIMVQKRNV